MKKMKNNNNHGYCKHVYGKYNSYHSFTSLKQIFDELFDKSSTNITLMIADDNFILKTCLCRLGFVQHIEKKSLSLIGQLCIYVHTVKIVKEHASFRLLWWAGYVVFKKTCPNVKGRHHHKFEKGELTKKCEYIRVSEQQYCTDVG